MTSHKLFSETFCALCVTTVCEVLAVKTFLFSTRFNTHCGENSACHFKSFIAKEAEKWHEQKRHFDFPLKGVSWPLDENYPWQHPQKSNDFPSKSKDTQRGMRDKRPNSCTLQHSLLRLSLTVLTTTTPRTKAHILHCYFCSSPFYETLCSYFSS